MKRTLISTTLTLMGLLALGTASGGALKTAGAHAQP
jgi:hypothetical protein